MIFQSNFKPAWWLPHAHMQTMYASLLGRREKPPIDKLERFELPDGDFIDLAWATNGLSKDTPLVILLHGLGGSVDSSYVAGQLHAYNRAGFRGVLMHFRGASETPNRLPRAYHSGETADLHLVLEMLKKREPATKKAVVGISMGGNVILKWLGEQKEQSWIDTAVAVSVPFQLDTLATHMNSGFARVYQRYLIDKLSKIFRKKYETYPDKMPAEFKNLQKHRSFWAFDTHVTAPLFGFKDAASYYSASSSRQFLKQIATPTLILHSADDPFMTPDAMPTHEELSSHIRFEVSPKGGHLGFISGYIPGRPRYWLDERIPLFLKAQL